MKVKMLKTVTPDLPFLEKRGDVRALCVKGEEYEARKNPYGAVTAITQGGDLGLKPDEFVVVEEDFLE